jgi:hypothetical protein
MPEQSWTPAGNPCPGGMPVQVRYPLTAAQEDGPRSAWPWLPGTILEQTAPDEWRICAGARELATLEDGSPAPDGTPEQDLYYPVCYRDASEIRPALSGPDPPERLDRLPGASRALPAELADQPGGARAAWDPCQDARWPGGEPASVRAACDQRQRGRAEDPGPPAAGMEVDL